MPQSEKDDPGYVYKTSLYVAVSSLPGNIFTIFCTDSIGPKPILGQYSVLQNLNLFYLKVRRFAEGFCPEPFCFNFVFFPRLLCM